MSNRWNIIKAYAEYADKHTAEHGTEQPWNWWASPEYLVQINGLGMEDKPAKNAAYQAYRAGMLEKNEVEENSYRIAQGGRDYMLKHPEPPRNMKKARAAKAKKDKPKTTQKVTEEVALGALFEVVGLDESGRLMARNTESNVIYRMEKV